MHLLHQSSTLVLNRDLLLPAQGIICAHPDRTKRIAHQYLKSPLLHSAQRGFQVYSGKYKDQDVFVANTGIGAPAAAFLIEELAALGARRILRLGSNDGAFTGFKLNIALSTTLPLGLCSDYQFHEKKILRISSILEQHLQNKAKAEGLPIQMTNNCHIDGYHAINFFHPLALLPGQSRDMETGALYLLSKLHGLECLSMLISYPKHEQGGEYCDDGKTLAFEGRCIDFALRVLIDEGVG